MNKVLLQRYDGHHLGDSPHIVVLGSCKVGNFVVTIPLLRLLRSKYPKSIIDFWGSEVTSDFEKALCGDNQPLSWRCSWDEKSAKVPLENFSDLSAKRNREAGSIDLLINCDGFNPLTQALASLLRPKFVAGCSIKREEFNTRFPAIVIFLSLII